MTTAMTTTTKAATMTTAMTATMCNMTRTILNCTKICQIWSHCSLYLFCLSVRVYLCSIENFIHPAIIFPTALPKFFIPVASEHFLRSCLSLSDHLLFSAHSPPPPAPPFPGIRESKYFSSSKQFLRLSPQPSMRNLPYAGPISFRCTYLHLKFGALKYKEITNHTGRTIAAPT